MNDTISILEDEHKHIIDALDLLRKIIDKGKLDNNDIKKLQEVSHLFIEAEKHHKREEDVLFPAIEKKGVQWPTDVMRMEHEELRKRKRLLAELCKKEKIDFKKIKDPAEFILNVLRAHIDKENSILYMIARHVLSKEEIKNMKREFDKIGYCCFHPVK